MRTTGVSVAAFVVTMGLLAPPASTAANKEHQQMMAELRMLQQEQQQLRQLLGSLSETLTLITARLEDQSGGTRKAFADQKLLIDGVAENARILREKADDTNVRLAKMTQEIQALRQTVASLPPAAQPAFPDPGDPAASDPANQTTPPAAAAPLNISPDVMWNRVYGDYTAGQYDLAIEGFQAYIREFPTSPMADDAQLYVGYSLYDSGKFADAAVALRRVISDYPQGDTVPRAWYKLGQTYEQMKQFDNARKAYETVVQNYPETVYEHILSNQALERLKRRDEEPPQDH